MNLSLFTALPWNRCKIEVRQRILKIMVGSAKFRRVYNYFISKLAGTSYCYFEGNK